MRWAGLCLREAVQRGDRDGTQGHALAVIVLISVDGRIFSPRRICRSEPSLPTFTSHKGTKQLSTHPSVQYTAAEMWVGGHTMN